MKLTPKEQKFAELCVELGNQSEAYRIAYEPKDKDADWIRINASKKASETNIALTIEQIKTDLKQANCITKQRIIDYHIQMVEAWEELWTLGKKKDKTKEEQNRFYLLKEMVKGSDYRGSLDSITKMLGLNEPEKVDHTIKKITIEEKKRDED